MLFLNSNGNKNENKNKNKTFRYRHINYSNSNSNSNSNQYTGANVFLIQLWLENMTHLSLLALQVLWLQQQCSYMYRWMMISYEKSNIVKMVSQSVSVHTWWWWCTHSTTSRILYAYVSGEDACTRTWIRVGRMMMRYIYIYYHSYYYTQQQWKGFTSPPTYGDAARDSAVFWFAALPKAEAWRRCMYSSIVSS